MRIVLTVLLLLATSAHAEELTNADVLRLVQAGLSAATVEAKIAASEPRFSVDTESLVALAKAGVPDSVVRLMIERQAAKSDAPQPESRAAAAGPRSSTPAAATSTSAKPAARPWVTRRRFDVAVHRTKTARCDGGEIELDSRGIRATRCAGLNFDLRWSDVQRVCFEYGFRATVVFTTASRDYKVSTELPITAKQIVEAVAALRPALPVREGCPLP